jgi:hypothetical protein
LEAASRNRRQRLTVRTPLERFRALIVAQLRPPAELHAVGQRPLAALAGAFPDELALELSDAGEQCREQAPRRRLGVPGRITDRPEFRTGLVDLVEQVEQFPGAATKTIKLANNNDVAGLQQRHELGQLRPVGHDLRGSASQ